MIESTSYYIQLEEGEATDSTIGSTFDSRVDSRVDSRIGSRVDERNDEGLTRVSYWTAQVGESNAAYGHKYLCTTTFHVRGMTMSICTRYIYMYRMMTTGTVGLHQPHSIIYIHIFRYSY